MTCAVTTSFLGCLATLFLYFRYVWLWHPGIFINLACLAGLLLAGCIPLLVGYQFENVLGKFYPYYRYGLYFVFIGCVILFTLTLIGDALWLIAHQLGSVGKFPCGREFCKFYNMVLIGSAFFMSCCALYAGTKVPGVKTVEIASSKISEPKTIVFLSDIHIHRTINPEKVAAIVEKANGFNPDLILLGGDVIDDEVAKVGNVTGLLGGLKAEDGVYFVTGNHEFYAGYKETVSELQRLGFKFLENSGVSLGDVYLAGVPDMFAGQSFGKKADLKKAFSAAEKRQFRLLASHSPADWGQDNNFDLEVSGHTHGGQIFPFHLFTLLHNKYLSGLYRTENGARIYVSRGAGQWGPQMRFLAPAEITVIKLIPEK